MNLLVVNNHPNLESKKLIQETEKHLLNSLPNRSYIQGLTSCPDLSVAREQEPSQAGGEADLHCGVQCRLCVAMVGGGGQYEL